MTGPEGSSHCGILPVDKPAGPTSHDVVARVRKLSSAKTGHAGTLDPSATGVLVVLLGAAVRLSDFYMKSAKEYLATVRFGMVSDTFDAQGNLQPGTAVPSLTCDQAEDLLEGFRGEIEQLPPMYSAVKVAGTPLHKSARRGEVVERKSRTVTITELELLRLSPDSMDLRIACTSGTYIRTLAHELGERLGCGGYLESLRRTRSGQFSQEQAIPYFKLETDWPRWLIPLENLLPDLPRIDLPEDDGLRARHGNAVPDRYGMTDCATSLLRIFSNGQFLALGRAEAGSIKPTVVLRPIR